MGMYDYLGGEQIKIFYIPIFSSGGLGEKGPWTWHSGGRLRSFDEKDELPLKTLYYQYPEDFMVYDYRFHYEEVWIIKNGKFSKLISYHNLTEENMVGPVYDCYGNQLEIKTVYDFEKIKRERKQTIEENQRIELAIFPNGVIETIRYNYEEYLQKEEQWNKVKYKANDEFNKWFSEDKFFYEKNFGEAIESYIHHKSLKNGEPDEHFNPNKDYQDCKAYVKSLLDKDASIIQRYKEWLNDAQMLNEIELDSLIMEIKDI